MSANCYLIMHGQTCTDNVIVYCRLSFSGKAGKGAAAPDCPLGTGAERKAFAHPSRRVAYTW